MLANNMNKFLETTSAAVIDALNSKAGQEMTTQLLAMKLADKPDLTPEEWRKTKADFVLFLFHKAMKESPELMDEFGKHMYNHLRGTEKSA